LPVKIAFWAGLLTGSESFPNVDFGDWLVNEARKPQTLDYSEISKRFFSLSIV
jgi:hypothetical protein